MSRGFKLNRVPVGAAPTNYKPGFRARQQERAAKVLAQTAEQSARSEALRVDFMRKQAPAWGVLPDLVDLWISNPIAYREECDRRAAQARAITKIEDRKAKAAVEGDTDLNHDNLEAAE